MTSNLRLRTCPMNQLNFSKPGNLLDCVHHAVLYSTVLQPRFGGYHAPLRAYPGLLSSFVEREKV
jgi:hypothetical protein